MYNSIKPTSIKSYLSGICTELSRFYLDVHSIHSSQLFNHSLARCTKLYGSPAIRNRALTEIDLLLIICSAPLWLTQQSSVHGDHPCWLALPPTSGLTG